MRTSIPISRLLLLPTLVALLGLALPSLAAAADVELKVVTIQATGKPTGAGPELDEAVRDLPGIDEWCLMFARCQHVSTTEKKVSWKQDLKLGSGKQQLTLTPQGEGEGDVTVLRVRIGNDDGSCLDSTDLAKPGQPIPRFCKQPSKDATMIYVITASRLKG